MMDEARVLLNEPLTAPVLAGLGLVLLWTVVLVVRSRYRRSALKDAAAELRLLPAGATAKRGGRAHGFEGWLGPRLLRLRAVGAGRRAWLVLETECLMPSGFGLTVGDLGALVAAGVPVERFSVVPSYASDGTPAGKGAQALASGGATVRCSDPTVADRVGQAWSAQTALPLNGRDACWFHRGRAGLALNLAGFTPSQVRQLAQTFEHRIVAVERTVAVAAPDLLDVLPTRHRVPGHGVASSAARPGPPSPASR